MLQSQYRFVYRVASRISETNLLRYLEGTYSDYVQVDAAVQIRGISQQPIEFCQYVLAGIQQLVTEGSLVALSVAGIIWYNSRLFLLLICLLVGTAFAGAYMGLDLTRGIAILFIAAVLALTGCLILFLREISIAAFGARQTVSPYAARVVFK